MLIDGVNHGRAWRSGRGSSGRRVVAPRACRQIVTFRFVPKRRPMLGARLVEDRRAEAFSKPIVDGGEKIASVVAPALFEPTARETDRRPQFHELCAL